MEKSKNNQTPPTLAEYGNGSKPALGKNVTTLERLARLGTLVVALLLTANFNTMAAGSNRVGDGSIVVIGDDLIVESDSPYPTIAWVLIEYASTGTQAAFYTGCGRYHCLYDISALPPGTYNITVQTSTTTRFYENGIVIP